MALVISNPNAPELYGRRWSATYNSANPHTIVVDTDAQKLVVQAVVDGTNRNIMTYEWLLGDPLTPGNPALIQRIVEDFWHARTGVAPT